MSQSERFDQMLSDLSNEIFSNKEAFVGYEGQRKKQKIERLISALAFTKEAIESEKESESLFSQINFEDAQDARAELKSLKENLLTNHSRRKFQIDLDYAKATVRQ